MEIITVEVSLSQGYKSPGDPIIRVHCLDRHSHNVLFNVIKIYLVCFSPAVFCRCRNNDTDAIQTFYGIPLIASVPGSDALQFL